MKVYDILVYLTVTRKSIKGTTHNSSKLVFQQMHARFLERKTVKEELVRNTVGFLHKFLDQNSRLTILVKEFRNFTQFLNTNMIS